jgi:two-component system sensor histidine kinase RegB
MPRKRFSTLNPLRHLMTQLQSREQAAASGVLDGLCLQYLLMLRVLTIAGQFAALAVSHYLLDITPPLAPIAVIIPAFSAITLVSWRRQRKGKPVTEQNITTHLLIDILGLTVLLFFTGGSANPFVSLLLLPVTVAAALLKPRYTWVIAAEAAICYTLLMFIHLHPLSIHVHPPHWNHTGMTFTLHIWGMWLGFLLSAAVVAYFVTKMGATLREHDRELAEARANALQANQMVMLGTLAAGTAHELGTPLATMAILAREIEEDYTGEPELTERIRVLRGQVSRCKEILSRMAERAGQAQADAGRQLSLDHYLEEILGEWRKLHPETPLRKQCAGSSPAPRIIADRTVTQAIANVLNNAADAARHAVEFEARWEPAMLRIEVRDDGDGLPKALREHIGKPFVTTKKTGSGMGLGLYLAQSTLQRLGGSLQLLDRASKGVIVKIELPLTSLAVDPL